MSDRFRKFFPDLNNSYQVRCRPEGISDYIATYISSASLDSPSVVIVSKGGACVANGYGDRQDASDSDGLLRVGVRPNHCKMARPKATKTMQ